MERMRARGFTLHRRRRHGSGASARGGRGQGPRQQGQGQAVAGRQAPAARPQRRPQPNATTFDALFGPLTQTETFGQVWLNKDNKLERVRLRLGISDGSRPS